MVTVQGRSSSQPCTPIVLNADDYALTPRVSQTIRDLAIRGRISATSCMTSMPFWPTEGPRLQELHERVDIGLHITLTDQPCLGPMPKLAPQGVLPSQKRLQYLGWTGRLPLTEIRDEICRQRDAFARVTGRTPDHLDGHQHVQQIPGITNIVLDIAQEIGGKIYIRTACDTLRAITRRKVGVFNATSISLAGSILNHHARQRDVLCNNGFSGVYNFQKSATYPRLFEHFLQHQKPGALIMCHPGHVDDELRRVDSLHAPREDEYCFLGSEAFTQALERHNIRITRMRHIV